MNKIVIAIDGYSSSGKSTMAKELAAKIGYAYIDSGAMYRAVTLYALRHGMIASDGSVDKKALTDALDDIHITFKVNPQTHASRTFLNGEDVEDVIRGMEVSEHVSPVAVIPEVRHHLVKLQQKYGAEKGIVMDGRDIGTTVFPNAEMKIFVNASPEVRAKRRQLELEQKGEKVDFNEVLANIKERDHIDTTRKESPLRKADDAILLDNDNLTHQEQMKFLLDTFERITHHS
ncbi:MAG: (d)CMP kinase [Prevotella sp.]|nr:(d)CMP kinase [Bacteroides sp.]MCM1366594.1 (d)CMP kinase [Prevotella sp.]MCM1437309.1 (d)CMP kinase [Prevotella sp.]